MKMPAVLLWVLVLIGIPFGMTAHAIQNTATGTIGGSPLIVTNATVTLTLTGNAVTSAVAEINPHAVATGSANNLFTYDVLPTMNAGDTGVDRVDITAPALYSALSVTTVSVGGVPQTLNCPAPGAGQYCASIAGQIMTVTLGTKVTVSLTSIQIAFIATAPGVPGSASFTSTVDDSGSAAALPQATVLGNANGNNGDGNNQDVMVTGSAVTSAVGEINPHDIIVGSTGNLFTYDVLPTMNAGDTGVDRVAVAAPAGYTALSVTTVSVGGVLQSLSCPAPGAGQYCASIAGQVVTVALGTKVTVSGTIIQIVFTASAPVSSGSASFTSTVDDSGTPAVPLQAAAAGNANGNNSDGNNQDVTVQPGAISSAAAEITPNSVSLGSSGNAFTFFVLPVINPGDTGVDRVILTAPAGYSALSVASVSAGGVAQTLNCPAPGAGQYCAVAAGQTMTVTLGTKVTASLSTIQIAFSATAPGTVGSGNFTAIVDDTSTALAAQATTAGNADGAATNANSITVQVSANAMTSVVAEITPNAVTTNSLGNVFTYSLLPTVNPGDTGVDQVTIAVPAGFSTVAATQVTVSGTTSTPVATCPITGPNQYCASGGTLTVRLPGNVTNGTANKRITVNFTANAPADPGSGVFSSTVDDTATANAPQAAAAGNADGNASNANSTTVNVLLVLPSDLNTTVTATPQIIIADGAAACTITTTMHDAADQPVPWKMVSLSSDRGSDVFTHQASPSDVAGTAKGVDIFMQPALPSDAAGTATGTVTSSIPGVSTITSTDVTDNIVFSAKPQIYFTQGMVLELIKTANKKEALIGDVVTYFVELKNKTAKDVVLVKVDDHIPPNFKYMKGSTLINGARAPDPVGNRTLTFDIGTVPALVDANNNSHADKGEAGYLLISYQLVIGSGATQKEYVNTAQARDVCDLCAISNVDDAKVTVTLDPLFDLGTIIGKVFEDKNKDGWQDPDEPGIPSVMVALDNGTYALTDEFGRYHLPAIKPGQRLVKINLQGLPSGAAATTDEAHIVSVTPGLLAKANFGVTYEYDVEKTGKPAETGIEVASKEKKEPLKLIGNTETLTLLMNGEQVPLHSSEVQIFFEGPDEIVTTKGKKLERDIEFLAEVAAPDAAKEWKLTIFNFSDEVVKTLQGNGAPPKAILWNGVMEKGQLVQGGEVYQYQMEISYLDGTGSTSTRRTFGINNISIISVRLTGSAFETGSTKLNSKAKEMLKQAAIVFREYPDEKIIIEGHSDSKGTNEANREISEKRARVAADYLIQEEKLEPGRFNIKGHGKKRPIASNKTAEGREQNRRVEVKGEVKEVENSKLRDYYRTEPSISINGDSLRVGPQGRFSATIREPLTDKLDINLVNSRGRSVTTSLAVPSFEIIEPKGEMLLPFEKTGTGYRVFSASDKDAVMVYRLVGRTASGNTIELDGEPLPVAADGGFTAELTVRVGRNNYGLLVRNAEGATRLANLIIDVRDADEDGKPIIVTKPIPNLAIKFPPAGARLTSETLIVSGITDAGNSIELNGERVTTDAEGQFSTTLKLLLGKNTVIVRAVDPDGNVGTLERELEVTDNKIFLLAFADGKFGRLSGKGNLQEAGMDAQKEYYSEGRVAYYLKGTIKGKYIITSAFDTGTHSFGEMFNNLDSTENDRLLTNLDPDKLYPVYGDSGTVVNDVQSQGKLYLAIDSDELHAIVGNYALVLGDTELAAYQRTLYGGRVAYQSVARTQYGRPDTTVLVFGAEVRQAHIQDEVKATGGSLYYLSHKDIIEGSEQISLIIRDKNTGLTLENAPQRQNVDYTIKYEEGRILFNRPILQSAEGSSLVDLNATQGDPVIIRADYETRLSAFDKKADGGRVRKQLGDHVAVGMSYVKDELLDAQYELKGVDSELRLGKNTRITTEYAESIGVGAQTFTSDDGGLAYQQSTPLGARQGHAWKTTIEADAGEWIDRPDRLFLGGYLKKLEPGFMSNGNAFDEGAEKLGFNAKLRVTGADTLQYRFDSERLNTSATTTAGPSTLDTTTIQAQHREKRWAAEGEYKSAESDYGLNPGYHASYGAGRYSYKVTEKLTTSIERQETITGARNDQTTAAVDYQVLPSLTLKISETQATAGDSAQGGVVYSANNNRVYVTERVADDQAGKNTTSTIVGGETQIGPSSKMYSEYQWNRADGAERDVSLIGALRNWDAGNGLKFMLSAEQSAIASNAGPTKRNSLAGGISYSSKTGLKVSTRNELRREYGANELVQRLTVNNLEYKLNTDFTVIGKYRFSRSRDLRNDRTIAGFDESSVGLAYRPVAHDWFNALAKYTSLSQQNVSLLDTTQAVKTKADVVSVEWSAELTRYVEWVEKEAARTKTEKIEDRDPVTTHTYLSIHRLNFHIWRPIDLGFEYRVLRQKEAQDQREGYLVELSWQMVKYLRFGVGYNFTDFSDNEFSDNNYSVRGWFVRLQSKY